MKTKKIKGEQKENYNIELNNAGSLVKKYEEELKQIESEEVIILQSKYIADAVIDVKKEKFGEQFVSIEEVLLFQKLMTLRLKEKGIKIRFDNMLFSNCFRCDNGVITKIEGKSFKKEIANKAIRQVIYDSQYIYYCLCKILITKLNNSVVHNCKNCVTECTGLLSHSNPNNCTKWIHNFAEDCKNYISEAEQSIIEESQSRKNPTKVLIRDIEEHIAILNQINTKD